MVKLIESRLVLAVRDLRASTQFYTDVLGFSRDFGDESIGWSFLSRDGFKVALGECPDERPASEIGNHSYVAYVTREGGRRTLPGSRGAWCANDFATHN